MDNEILQEIMKIQEQKKKRKFLIIGIVIGGSFIFFFMYIAILGAILFPVFSKAREKARQTSCVSNQKQIATSVLMYTQENNDKMPVVDENWTKYLGITNERVYHCPSASSEYIISYGINKNISKVDFGSFKSPAETILTADSDTENNIIAKKSDVAMRHDRMTIIGFVDTHIMLTGDDGFSDKNFLIK